MLRQFLIGACYNLSEIADRTNHSRDDIYSIRLTKNALRAMIIIIYHLRLFGDELRRRTGDHLRCNSVLLDPVAAISWWQYQGPIDTLTSATDVHLGMRRSIDLPRLQIPRR